VKTTDLQAQLAGRPVGRERTAANKREFLRRPRKGTVSTKGRIS
jgi:hypothetical protein